MKLNFCAKKEKQSRFIQDAQLKTPRVTDQDGGRKTNRKEHKYRRHQPNYTISLTVSDLSTASKPKSFKTDQRASGGRSSTAANSEEQLLKKTSARINSQASNPEKSKPTLAGTKQGALAAGL